MRIYTEVALCVALGVLPGIAIAAADGLYVGGNVGWSNFSGSNTFTDGKSSNTAGVGLFAGYQYAPWFSLEAGFSYLGDANGGHNSEMTVQGLQLSGKLGYTDEDWQVYSRLGGIMYRSDVTRSDRNDTISGHDISPLVAMGIEHSFNTRWTTRVEYQLVANIKNSAASDASLDNRYLSLGVTYHFGEIHQAQSPVSTSVAVLPTMAPNKTTVVVLPSLSLLYGFNQYALSAENQLRLDAWLRERVKQKGTWGAINLLVEGYSSPEGSEHNNMIVSQRRVEAVEAYLLQQGIAVGSVDIEAKGETIQFDQAEKGRKNALSLNRRVEIYSL